MAIRSDKIHEHKPQSHIKLLLFDGAFSRIASFFSIRRYPFPLSFSSYASNTLSLLDSRAPPPLSPLSFCLTHLNLLYMRVASLRRPLSIFLSLSPFLGLTLPLQNVRNARFSPRETCVLPAAAHAPTRRPPIWDPVTAPTMMPLPHHKRQTRDYQVVEFCGAQVWCRKGDDESADHLLLFSRIKGFHFHYSFSYYQGL